MISVNSVYNQILSSIECDLPLTVKRPNSVKRSKSSSVTAEKQSFEDALDTAVKTVNIDTKNIDGRIETAVKNAAKKYDIAAELIMGVIKTESSFNPSAVSSSGAMGLMQLMPGTAGSLGVSDPFNIEQNIDGGVRYLRQMLDRFDNDLSLALAAYNAGPGSVLKYGGIPPFSETQNYVPKVLANSEMYKS